MLREIQEKEEKKRTSDTSQTLQGSLNTEQIWFGSTTEVHKTTSEKPQVFWNNARWTNHIKVQLFGLNVQHRIWWKLNTAFKKKYLILPLSSTAKKKVMIWSCFPARGLWCLADTDYTMNSSAFQSQMWGHLSNGQSLIRFGSCNGTMIPHTAIITRQRRWLWILGGPGISQTAFPSFPEFPSPEFPLGDQ